MSQRGRGCCPGCKAEYFNCTKPPNCNMCGFALGGTFEPSRKKMKYSPQAVEVKSGSIYSVKTSRKDDRCFVTTDGTLWFCSVEKSSQLANFTCTHVDQVKSNYQQVLPVAVLSPNLDKFVASESLKDSIKELIKNATSCAIEHIAMQVSDTMYCVYGPITASNPLGYCNVRKNTDLSHFLCTGKDCRVFAGKGKQLKSKSMCIHVSILHACLIKSNSDTSQSTDNCPNSADANLSNATDNSNDQHELTQRISTLQLAEKTKALPYKLPQHLLESVSRRDACTLLGVGEEWPDCFVPDSTHCELCGAPLGSICVHPGQAKNAPCYLITELNPFKKVEIRVKFCLASKCSAMHQATVEKIGMILYACLLIVLKIFNPDCLLKMKFIQIYSVLWIKLVTKI